MKVLNSIICLIFSITILLSQGLETFQSGNTAYSNKDYAEAITAYNSLIADGKVSAEVYHNLGNAYYQINSYGESMLAYERGLSIKPDHEAILHDRDILKNLIESDIFEVPAFLPVRLWRSFCRILPDNVWIFIQLLGLVGILGYLFVFWIRPVSLHPSWLHLVKYISGIIVIISTLALLSTWHQQQSDMSAIVMKETILYTGADERSEEVAPIKAGEKVNVLEAFDGWYRVRLLNLEEGFVQNTDIKNI